MSATQKEKLQHLLEFANKYPSPHNGQPMILTSSSDAGLEVFFDTSRGLTATPISHLFSFVTIGVFMRHFELCAKALGHATEIQLTLPNQADMARPGSLHCAQIGIRYAAYPEDSELEQAIRKRQTSRKKYSAGLTEEEKRRVTEITKPYGVTATFMSPDQAKQTIWLNQRAVFDDMFNPAVRTELDHWLRYSAEEKKTKRDGLAYDCMELSGSALRFAVNHYPVLHWPVVSSLLKQYYLRTMQDNSTVGYFTSPFQSEMQAYTVGQAIIEVWLSLAAEGHYLHPFGTIVSNETAHADFAKLASLLDESQDRKYVAFIFRAGASVSPVESERIPVKEHLYIQEKV